MAGRKTLPSFTSWATPTGSTLQILGTPKDLTSSIHVRLPTVFDEDVVLQKKVEEFRLDLAFVFSGPWNLMGRRRSLSPEIAPHVCIQLDARSDYLT